MEFEKGDYGAIKIHNEVITTIVRKAAMEIEGVERIASGFKKGLLSFFGHKRFSRGVTIEKNKENEIKVTLSVVIKFGVNIPEIVNKIQLNVKRMLEQIAGVTPLEINVEIEKVAPEENFENVIEEITTRKGKGGKI